MMKEGSSEKSHPHTTESRFGFLNAVQKVLNGVRKCKLQKERKKRPLLGPIFLTTLEMLF
jgi:hypothetical protein